MKDPSDTRGGKSPNKRPAAEKAAGAKGAAGGKGAAGSNNAADSDDAWRNSDGLPFAMVVTDPHLDDNPIIYVNKSFERITQYSADFAIGRNCRFLQGEETDEADVQRIRDGIEKGEDVSVDIVNYRADGSPFRNRLLIVPMYDEAGKVMNFLGVQRCLPDEAETGEEARGNDPVAQDLRLSLEHGRAATDRADGSVGAEASGEGALASIRDGVESHLRLMMSLARIDGASPKQGDARSLGRRIESLQLLYEELDEAGVSSVFQKTVPVGAYLSRVAATLNHIEGRRSIRMNVDCDQVEMPSEDAARLGLLLSELVLNALRHAFVGRREGLVNVEFKALTGDRVRLSVKDDGVGLEDEVDWPFFQDEGAEDAEERRTGQQVGAKLVRRLVEALDAAIDVRTGEFGTTVEVGLRTGRPREQVADRTKERANKA